MARPHSASPSMATRGRPATSPAAGSGPSSGSRAAGCSPCRSCSSPPPSGWSAAARPDRPVTSHDAPPCPWDLLWDWCRCMRALRRCPPGRPSSGFRAWSEVCRGMPVHPGYCRFKSPSGTKSLQVSGVSFGAAAARPGPQPRRPEWVPATGRACWRSSRPRSAVAQPTSGSIRWKHSLSPQISHQERHGFSEGRIRDTSTRVLKR